ncbi:MAG: uracil-DNA glycosylase [Gammaproteobacteria bacterium]
MTNACFDPACVRCDRLAEFLADLRTSYPDYHNQPVPAFGDPKPRLLIVGLAPGMHGANASGRPFTGDFAGNLLYRCLFEVGLSSAPESTHVRDELHLSGCRITNAVKCLPPENKPTTQEIDCCNSYLVEELRAVPNGGVVLALGLIAHRAVLRAFSLRLNSCRFGHGEIFELPGYRWLVDSYHCSRYNTQTGRLTKRMFKTVLANAKSLAFV